MATKKKDAPSTDQVVGDNEAQIEERRRRRTEAVEATQRGTGDPQKRIEDKRKRREEATTVVGDESFPPPGMDLPDGGQVPLDESEA